VLAAALGETVTQERLAIYADDLGDLTQEQIERALLRARRELRFFPKIAELREFAGVGIKQHDDAEMRAAWDATVRYVDKYVNCDPHGNYGPEFGRYGPHGYDRKTGEPYPAMYPQLPQRILDVVRRTGGWKVYACMDERDFPFQQQRFFDEYQAWPAVQSQLSNISLAPRPARRKLTGETAPPCSEIDRRLREIADAKSMAVAIAQVRNPS
jgi:hypothetical protein